MNRSSSFVQRTCRIVFRFRSHVKPGRTFWDFCRKDAAGLFRTLENWLMLTSVTQRELMYVVWVTVGFRIRGAILGLLVTVCSVAMGTPCGMVGLRLNIFLAGWKLSLRLILPHLVITHSLNCNFHKNKISLINTRTFSGSHWRQSPPQSRAAPRGPPQCFSGTSALTRSPTTRPCCYRPMHPWVGAVEAGVTFKFLSHLNFYIEIWMSLKSPCETTIYKCVLLHE